MFNFVKYSLNSFQLDLIKIGNEYDRYQAISGNEYEHFYLLDTKNGAVYNHIENPENTYYIAKMQSNDPQLYFNDIHLIS